MVGLPKKNDSRLTDDERMKIFLGLLVLSIIPTSISMLYFGPILNHVLLKLFVGAFGHLATELSAIKLAMISFFGGSIMGMFTGAASIFILDLLAPRLAVVNNVGGFSWNVVVAFTAIACVVAAGAVDMVCAAYAGLNKFIGFCRGNGGDAGVGPSTSGYDIPTTQQVHNQSPVTPNTPSAYLGFGSYRRRSIDDSNNLNQDNRETRQPAPSITQRVRALCSIM